MAFRTKTAAAMASDFRMTYLSSQNKRMKDQTIARRLSRRTQTECRHTLKTRLSKRGPNRSLLSEFPRDLVELSARMEAALATSAKKSPEVNRVQDVRQRW